MQSAVDTSHSSSRGKRPPSSCLGKERVEAQDELPVALEQPPDLCDDTGRVDPDGTGDLHVARRIQKKIETPHFCALNSFMISRKSS